MRLNLLYLLLDVDRLHFQRGGDNFLFTFVVTSTSSYNFIHFHLGLRGTANFPIVCRMQGTV